MIEAIEDISSIEDIEELIGEMDAEQLRHLVMKMTREMGVDDAALAICDVVTIEDGKIILRPYCAPSYDIICRLVETALSRAMRFSDEDYDGVPDSDKDQMRAALWDMEKRVVCDVIGFFFEGLVIDILGTSGEEEVQKLVTGVAEALRDNSIPWPNTPDDSMEYRKAYADSIEQRFRDGEYDAMFAGFGYDDQYQCDDRHRRSLPSSFLRLLYFRRTRSALLRCYDEDS